MTERTDGGAAFPQMTTLDRGTIYDGLSLRDWFAGQALMGLAAYPRSEQEGNKPYHFARWSYAIADAMLAERAK